MTINITHRITTFMKLIKYTTKFTHGKIAICHELSFFKNVTINNYIHIY
jgi:hypothetical protein